MTTTLDYEDKGCVFARLIRGDAKCINCPFDTCVRDLFSDHIEGAIEELESHMKKALDENRSS